MVNRSRFVIPRFVPRHAIFLFANPRLFQPSTMMFTTRRNILRAIRQVLQNGADGVEALVRDLNREQ